MVDITFRGDDSTRWGTGSPTDLTADQINTNFWNTKKAIEDLIANPGAPIEILSITSSGTKLTFNMSDGSTIGPVYLPILSFHWREDWAASTAYDELDIFRVAGVGLYMVLVNHTSGLTFDKNAVDSDSNPLYLEMFVFAPAENVVYDIGFNYAGVLKDIPNSIDRIWEEPIIRKVLLPVTPAVGSHHRVRARIAPSTHAQVFTIYQNEAAIGTATIPVGQNAGTVTLTSDITLTANVDSVGLGRQGTDDAVAGGLSFVLAAQQVVGT